MAHINAQRLQELIDEHGPALTLYARQFCRAAEDAVQEALVELVRQDPQPGNLVGWLYVATRCRALNLDRAERRRKRHHRQSVEGRQQWFVPASSGLEEPMDLEPLLASLPGLEREIVIARIWGERSFVQIAELVQQPLSSVHRRYQQALAELGRQLQRLQNPSRSDYESSRTIP